jgi:hypothetical protein
MSFKTTYESDFYKIEIDQENNLLRSEWLRAVSKEEMIAGGTRLFETLRDTGITRAITNAQRLVLLDAATKEWMSTQFFSLLSRTKLQKLARVLPSSLFSKLALESVATRADANHVSSFVYKNFVNQQEALNWLKA